MAVIDAGETDFHSLDVIQQSTDWEVLRLQTEVDHATQLISIEPNKGLQSTFELALRESLASLEGLLRQHTGQLRISTKDDAGQSVDYDRERITAINLLAFPGGEGIFAPVADLRIRRPEDKPIQLFKSEIPNPGRWYRVPLSQVTFRLLP